MEVCLSGTDVRAICVIPAEAGIIDATVVVRGITMVEVEGRDEVKKSHWEMIEARRSDPDVDR
jgi:hypothetical protein